MILIVTLAVIFSTSLFFNLPEKLTEQSFAAHHFCLQLLPTSLENHSSLEALVCGKNMQDLELKQLLVQSSLIHIFIVSGSHFHFLNRVFARIPLLRLCPLLLLSIYCIATLCQPPAVRALCFLFLQSFSNYFRHTLPAVLMVFLSGLFSVALFPQWLVSRSLLMSLMASLAMAFVSDLADKERSPVTALFLSQAAIYVVMGFCLWGYGSLHPLGMVFNLLLGPFVGGVIFPLALLVVAAPPLVGIFDILLNGLFWLLQKSSEIHTEAGAAVPLPLTWQWLLHFMLVGSAHSYFVNKKRRKAAHE